MGICSLISKTTMNDSRGLLFYINSFTFLSKILYRLENLKKYILKTVLRISVFGIEKRKKAIYGTKKYKIFESRPTFFSLMLTENSWYTGINFFLEKRITRGQSSTSTRREVARFLFLLCLP